MLTASVLQSSDSWKWASGLQILVSESEVFTFCDVIEYVQCHLAEKQSPWCQHGWYSPGLTSPCPSCKRNAKSCQSMALKDLECSYYLSHKASFFIQTKGQLNQKINKAYLYCRTTIWNSSVELLKWVKSNCQINY